MVFAAFSIVNGSLLSMQPPLAPLMTPGLFLSERLTEALLCGAVLVYALVLKRSFDFAQLWRIVMFLLATDLFLALISPHSVFQSFFASISLNFIVLFVWLTLADVARHSSVPSSLVFGIGWSCYTLPFFIGAAAVWALGLTYASTPYIAALLYAIALVTAFCLESRDSTANLLFGTGKTVAEVTPVEFSTIDARCAALGAERDLTSREIEIMALLCKGRTKAYIAETLFITENTVKGHAKRLYAKLGVHSKKELQKLVDAD